MDAVTYLVKEGVHLLHYNGYNDILGEGKSPLTKYVTVAILVQLMDFPLPSMSLHAL